VKPFTYTGIWWLPETSPDEGLYGTLSFNSESRIELGVLGHLIEDGEVGFTGADIILGLSDEGKRITLLQNRLVGESLRAPEIGQTRFHPKFVLVGRQFQRLDDVAASGMYVTFDRLNAWSRATGLRMEYEALQGKPPHKISAIYEEPSEPEIFLFLDMKLEFVSALHSDFNLITNVDWKPQVWMKVTWPGRRGVPEIVEEIVYRLRNLIAFGVGESTHVSALTIVPSDKDITDRERLQDVEVYYGTGASHREQQSTERYEMLFHRETLDTDLGRVLAQWFTRSHELEPVYNLYFSTLYQAELYLENQLLNYMQALETYNRRTILAGTYLPKDVFRRFVKSVFVYVNEHHPEIPSDVQEVFRNSFSFANEFTQKTRLSETLSRLGSIVHLLIPDVKTFVDVAVATRNYLTHYSEQRHRASKLRDLYILVQQLRFVLELCLLRELSLTDSQITEIVQENQRYQNTLRMLRRNDTSEE
jgi:hypothetical protein